MFRFKQFIVDQTGCAMKINTDGVLLGAMTIATNTKKILDIGTGTGVIALMLAQRYQEAQIDAVEIDKLAAETAHRNFKNSDFSSQLSIHAVSISNFFEACHNEKFDLIISNPPFYINSLESPKVQKNVAKHTEVSFFKGLIKDTSEYLSGQGTCWLILPVKTAVEIKTLAKANRLFLQQNVMVKSFNNSEPHREILCFGFDEKPIKLTEFVIYDAPGIYSGEYKKVLAPYFLNF